MEEQSVEKNLSWFVGIDWATEAHEVCVVDNAGKKVAGKSFAHSGDGLAALCDWLLSVTAVACPSAIAVVIELVRGALVSTLLERGFQVYSCNPKQSDRFRDRHSMGGAKSDVLDAFVLAEAARKDRALLRKVKEDSPGIAVMRELSRAHAELTDDALRLENRLREQFLCYYPQMLAFGTNLDELWRLDLWELAPTPESASELKAAKVKALLRRHRIRRLTADDVVKTLQARKLFVAPGATEAAVLRIRTLIAQLRVLREQLRSVDKQIEQALKAMAGDADSSEQSSEQRDVTILMLLPGVGKVIASTLLAEAAELLRTRDYHQMRAMSGVAPVTRQTGKQGRSKGSTPFVSMRRACNDRLRNALWHWAMTAAANDPYWKAKTAQLRERGKNLAQTRRIIGDRLLRMLCACLRDGKHWDPTRHAIVA